MGEYSLSLPEGINSFDHDGETYEAGDDYEAKSACDAIAFYNAARAANADLGRQNNTEGFWQNTEAACAASPAPVDPQAPPQGTTPPPSDAPPTDDGDDADQQSAPRVDPPVDGGTTTPPPTDPDLQDPPRTPPPGEQDPENSDQAPQEPTAGGDPVDLFSGRFTLQDVDLELNTAVLPLDMVRMYQSGQSYFGPFGWGWDHNHNRYLRELNTGAVAHWTGQLREEIHQPKDGGWAPAPGVFHQLERLPGPNTRYALHAPERLTSIFEQPPGWTLGERIPLVQVIDRFGNTLNYTYDAASRLARVADEDGRFLDFTYGECGLLEQVTDHAGRSAVYEHHNDVEHLACVRLPATDDHPDGLWRAYDYAQAHLPPPLNHAITQVMDGDGQVFLQTVYETDPSSTAYGRVVEQLAADQLFQFRTTPLQYVPARGEFLNIPSLRVEVMAPDYAVYTHTYNYRGDLLDYRFRLVADGSFRVVATSYGYDTEGNRIRTTLPDGSEELRTYAHDHPDIRMRGKLLQRELRARAGFPSPSRITLRITYAEEFQLIRTLQDESGSLTRYVYDFDTAPGPGVVGKLEQVDLPDATLPDGSVQPASILLDVDARGRLAALTSAEGHVQRYTFGPAGGSDAGLPIETLRDAGGLNITEILGYDANGNIAQTIDGMGAATLMEHNARNQLYQIAMPQIAGKSGRVQLHYDRQGDLIEMTRPRGDYDDATLAGAPIADRIIRNVQGHIASTTFAANTTAPRSQSQITDYRGLVICATDPVGTETRQCFDERGLQLRQVETGADGTTRQNQWVYDRTGRLEINRSGTDATTETRYDYDAFGRLAKITLPTGAEQTYTYGPGDTILDEQLVGDDGTGTIRLLARKSYTYDERGRPVTETRFAFEDNPAAAQLLTVKNTFDADDRLVATEDHRGAITRMGYDGLGRLVSLTDAAGNITEHSYDAAGRRISTRHHDQEQGGVVTREETNFYDARGRRTQSTDPAGVVTQVHYDDRNAPVRIEAALGLVTTHSFGAMGELLMRTVDPAGIAASYRWRYDAMLRPTQYTDPEGDVTRFVHDGLGRMTRVDMPNGFSSRRNYSADGRISSEQISGGSTIKFGYDAAGRLNQMTGAASAGSQAIADHAFVHDARGHITRASAGALVSSRKIDSLGRVLEEVSEGLSHRNSFDDLAGTIDRHWTDGRHEQIETDLMGRPIRVSQLAPGTLAEDIADLAQFSFAGASQLETRDVFGVLSGENMLDARKRVQAHVITAGGGTVESQTYRHDALGRTAVAQSALAGAMRLHRHDLPGRLTGADEGFAPPALGSGTDAADHATDIAAVTAAAAAPPMSRSYDYDRADARLQATRNGTATAYAYGPGKVMASAGVELMASDAEGRRVQDAQNQYEYDVLGRVVRILRADGSAERARLSYDALGRLHSSQEAGSSVRRHVYFGASEVEEHAGGALLRQFSPDPFLPLPLAVHQGGASLAPIYDQRLTRVGLTDSAGAIVERYAYAPFGAPQVMAPDASARATSAFDLAPVFGGMRYLPNAGVYHTRNRIADPRHGVFLSTDPMGPLDSANLYAFARQNPADFSDPDGDLAFLAGLLIAAAVGAVVAGGFNAARQTIAIQEGSQEGWEWGQFGLSVGMGAVIAPALVVAPELAIPLAAYGVANGGVEIARGNYYTGAFDVATAVLPFGFKGVRTGAMGRGSAIGQARGRGPMTPLSTRVGRFQLIGENARHMLPRLRGRRIGLGFSQGRRGPEGHVAVILENGERGFWFVEKNAAKTPNDSLVANFNQAETPPPVYLDTPHRPFVYESMSISEQAVAAASEHARGRLNGHLVEPFDFKSANCSHFGCDVLGAAGFRGLGNGRGSGLWSDFTNLSLARTMMRAATMGPPHLGEHDGASEDAPTVQKKE